MRLARGVVRAFDAEGHTATVQPLGSAATYMHQVKVSLEVTVLAPGEQVLLALLDEHSPDEALVVCRF